MSGFSADLSNLASTALDALGLSQSNTISSATSGTSYPWSNIDSKFFNYLTIRPERWDQLFPYRLLVIDSFQNNKIVNGSSNAAITVQGSNSIATIIFEPLGNQWNFTLPITPQQLNIADQYAINTSATLRGVIEEHSGIKFKMINASGSMGVWPSRPTATTAPGSPNIVQSLFGGTIAAAGNLVNQINSVVNVASGKSPSSKPTVITPELSQSGSTSTGYYQALALQQFLEQYVEAKKDPNNAGWRLVFDIPKQNQSFVVTPMQFVWQQNANKSKEILYTLQLKAWRRIDLQEQAIVAAPSLQPITPGLLQTILNTVTEARSAVAASVNLIGAVRSDINTPLEILRQTSLFVKDLAGATVTAADLPFQVQSDYQNAISDSLQNLNTAISSSSSDPTLRSALSAIVASSALSEGLTGDAVANGQLGAGAVYSQAVNPANNPFTKPYASFDLINQVPIYSLKLNDAQQAVVDQAVQNARQITIANLKAYRVQIQTLATQLSNSFGAGNAFYNNVYGLPAPATRVQPMSVDEFELLNNLYGVVQAYDLLTATTQIDDLNKQNNMSYVAGLADLSGIEFNLPASKILAPVPFGLTIEQIAARYLNSPQRWLEIVTLNNLKEPYIDENGFQLSLLSNGNGRNITISSNTNLYIGQKVTLSSLNQQPSSRTILNIERLSDFSFLLTLDGLPNLSNYTTFNKAYMQAYLPGTVNSQQKIFIPSDIPVPNDPNVVIPTSTASDPLTGLSKVDLLLTDNGDLAVNNYGDFRYSSGITNIVQALKIKLSTQKGKILLHPEFGLGVKVGGSIADVDVQNIYNSIKKMIEEDPRFQGLSSLQVTLNGPAISISMGVTLAGVRGVFPLSFQLV